jgi:hypothetical protein
MSKSLYFHRDEMLRLGYPHVALQTLDISLEFILGVSFCVAVNASTTFFFATRGVRNWARSGHNHYDYD